MDFNPADAPADDRPKLLDEGHYDLEVYEAEEAMSSKGNPMIKLQLVPVGQKGPRIYEYLVATEAAMFRIRQFCEATGLTDNFERGRLTEADCRGKRVRAYVVIESQGDYPDKNKVEEFKAGAAEKVAATHAHPDTPHESDIPF